MQRATTDALAFRRIGFLEDKEDFHVWQMLAEEAARCRRWQFVRVRMHFGNFADDLEAEGGDAFYSMFRMHRPSFEKLAQWVGPNLEKEELQSKRRSQGAEPIDTNIQLYCLIRYLAGGSLHDIRLIAGVSKTAFYASIHDALDAILQCPQLAIQLPRTDEELNEICDGFTECSLHEVMSGCV